MKTMIEAIKEGAKHPNGRNIQKPCLTLEYCPYGMLIENFPLANDKNVHRSYKRYECKVYGHICPAILVAIELIGMKG